MVPFWGSYVESYKVIPKGTTMEPMDIGFMYRGVSALRLGVREL